MFERFTERAHKVMAIANQEATRFNHEYIGTEHLLLGLVKDGSGVGANVLRALGVDLPRVREDVEKLVKPGPNTVLAGKLPQTPKAKKVIEYAVEEARNLNHNYVGTEHLLLGLLRASDSVAAQVLMDLGVTLEGARQEVLNIIGGEETPAGRGARLAALQNDLRSELQKLLSSLGPERSGELAEVVAGWEDLAPPVRKAVLAIVRDAAKS